MEEVVEARRLENSKPRMTQRSVKLNPSQQKIEDEINQLITEED